MEKQGNLLEVGLKQVDLDHGRAIKFDLEPGSYAQLSVKDTGHGMDLTTVDRIFDPYFTTKSADRGTGLGLAVVHGIVSNCSGAIDVSSQLNVGTVFDIYFPCVETKDMDRPSEVDSVRPALPFGSEQILLVDDEQMVADFTAEMLGHLGYRVVLQTDPVQALDHFRKSPEQFDLVISDMTMPGMDGERLARELMSIRPEIPVILCTGYSEKMDLEKAGQIGAKAFLFKPVKMKELAVAVRETLDGL
jgi:CheY-like chemotaxis protein